MKFKLNRAFRSSRIARILKFKLSVLKQLSKPKLIQITNVITDAQIDLVLDVGANVGQFGTDLRNAGYHGEILSFEPASAPFKQLLKNSHKDRLWTVFNLGFGEHMKEVNLHIANNSGLSSSILQPDLHSLYFPLIKFDITEKIQISTISNFIQERHLQNRRILLKIDTQGYENLILQGATEVFDSVFSTYIELSLVELYDGEASALSILNQLNTLGHEIFDIARGLESKSGRLLQIDVLTKKC